MRTAHSAMAVGIEKAPVPAPQLPSTTAAQPAIVGDEMRAYSEQQRGNPLFRVGSGWMFGSGN